ncbi:MAG: hypothetical protein PHX21_13855, partial [bacterium]|nr:hypothetical protein [bacterium]
FLNSVVCPHCSSSHIGSDMIGIDKKHLFDSEITMSYNFCWDCKHIWIDYDEEFLETLKEIREKFKITKQKNLKKK